MPRDVGEGRRKEGGEEGRRQGPSHIAKDGTHLTGRVVLVWRCGCRHTDFLLIIIKALLARRKDLKVVLMSATLQASLFSQYFDGCPAIHVPGR